MLQVSWKTLWYIHRNFFLTNQLVTKILKIGPHFPKVIIKHQGVYFLRHSVLTDTKHRAASLRQQRFLFYSGP